MGERVILNVLKWGDYVDEVTSGVHATGVQCGDGGTLCGMHFVDGLIGVPTKKPVDCHLCIDVLEDAKGYKRIKGKWF